MNLVPDRSGDRPPPHAGGGAGAPVGDAPAACGTGDALFDRDAGDALFDPDPEADGCDAASDGDAAAAPAALRARAAAVDDAQMARWLAQIVERDERALSALYDHTLSRVYGLVLRIVRQPACAEEVVEDTYFQVWRQAPRFDPARGRALSWLLAVARSRAIDALRRESRFTHEGLDGDDAQPVADDALAAAADLVDGARGQALLEQALLDLGAQPRQLVALAFFRGLSHEEIAAQTALPLGTVKSQIRRALIRLREVLGRSGLQAWAN